MICLRCQAEVAGSPKFCPKCGTKFDVSTVQATTPPIRAIAELAPAMASVAPQDSVICPKCGTPNLPTARFCKTDGTPLWEGASSQRPAVPLAAPEPTALRTYTALQPVQHPTSKSRKTILIVSMVSVVLLTSGIGGYLYWAGYVGDRQGSVAQTLNSELSSKGLGRVKVNVDKDWTTAVEGQVASQAEKDQALALIKQHGELKADVIDTIRVKPSRAEMEVQLNKALADAGMGHVTAQIDEGFTTVTLNDADLAPENRAKAEQLMTSTTTAAAGVAPVRFTHAAPTTQPPLPPAGTTSGVDGTAVARTLNEQLRNAGLGGVSALVDVNGNANLQGTVASHDDKDRAIQLALSHQGVAGVGDLIQVAPQTASPTPPRVVPPAPPVRAAPAPAPIAKLDAAKLEGDINRALRDGGVGGVTAQVTDDFSVTLKGAATSAGQKARAFQIARQFGVRGAPKDRVFIVEQ